jgi:hypothetical protein
VKRNALERVSESLRRKSNPEKFNALERILQLLIAPPRIKNLPPEEINANFVRGFFACNIYKENSLFDPRILEILERDLGIPSPFLHESAFITKLCFDKKLSPSTKDKLMMYDMLKYILTNTTMEEFLIEVIKLAQALEIKPVQRKVQVRKENTSSVLPAPTNNTEERIEIEVANILISLSANTKKG